ncbi:uncharacterized protein [Typha latifolia]|uniref:uncharacterized protein n=1 Tax=Typha latifolia TaxID=4733 RepID=UPI003C2CBBDD
MWRLISALRQRRTARVADDSGLGTEVAGHGPAAAAAAAEAGSGWSGALAALLAVARAPLMVAAWAAGAFRGGEEDEAAAAAAWAERRGPPRPDEVSHLMVRESMRYAIYV